MLCKGVEFMITLFDYKHAVIDTIYPPFNEVNKKSVQKRLKRELNDVGVSSYTSYIFRFFYETNHLQQVFKVLK